MASDVHKMLEGETAGSSEPSGGSDRSDSPVTELTQRSESPSLTQRSDSPVTELTQRSESPSLTQRSNSPVTALTQRSDSPVTALTQRSESPSLTQRSNSPVTALTQRSESPSLTQRSNSPVTVLTQRSKSPALTQRSNSLVTDLAQRSESPSLTQRSNSPVTALIQRSESPSLTQRSNSPVTELTQRSESPLLTQRSNSPVTALTQRSKSPAMTQRSDSPVKALSQGSESPMLIKRSDSPVTVLTQGSQNAVLTHRSDSPVTELMALSYHFDSPSMTQRSESPVSAPTQVSESPALSQRSGNPVTVLTRPTGSPTSSLTQRSDSPVTALTQGTEPGASQDESMFVHARSYEDLTEEDDVTVPRSPGVEGDVESSSMEQISQDFTKLSTQLSVSSLHEDDHPREETSEPGQRSSTRSVSGEDEVFRALDAWYQHQKHVFVLSEAGKPVYSRYRSDEVLSSMAGVMMALVSFVETEKNAIRSIHADGYKVVFLRRSPLVLVSVSQTLQAEHEIAQELIYVYYQIVSLLTGTQLHHLFQQRPSYDLRRLLSGSERITDSLLNLIDVDPSFLLLSVRCFPLAPGVRDSAGSSLLLAKAKSLVFSILMSGNHLVSLVRRKDQLLHSSDLQLLFNLVSSSSSFREGEAWTPVCFPKFNPSGFFHAHISYLNQDPELCLLLISTDREDFFTASDSKKKIMERLEKRGHWGPLTEALKKPYYEVSQTGIQDLRHFIYKSKSAGLFTSPATEPPYHTLEGKKRLLSLYQYLHSKVHSTPPLTTIYHAGDQEITIAWVTEAFVLYVCFSPLVTKAYAVSSIQRLLRWIRKEEDRLFILTPYYY
uniref:Vacuolar fusion protein MON1 homolog n=1 Tax=Leptobrachium leishanense TaxID=445787 RepID=A0A8C5PFY7_9ANUR